MTATRVEQPELVERLRKLMKRAEPLPWCWEQCGEKEDAPVIGVAFDANENALSGQLPDYGDEIHRWNIASDIGSGIDASAPSANAAFIVEAVNAIPQLLATIAASETDQQLREEVERLRHDLTRSMARENEMLNKPKGDKA